MKKLLITLTFITTRSCIGMSKSIYEYSVLAVAGAAPTNEEMIGEMHGTKSVLDNHQTVDTAATLGLKESLREAIVRENIDEITCARQTDANVNTQSSIQRFSNIHFKNAFLADFVREAIEFVRPQGDTMTIIADVNMRYKNGDTPLHGAVEKGDFAVTQLSLLPQRCTIDYIIKLFIAYGADVNAVNAHGQTPLHVAAEEGHIEIAKLLIAYGADVNAQDELGRTPLHWAVMIGNAPFFCSEMRKRTSTPWLDLKERCDMSPLSLYRALIIRNLKVARLLLKNGAHVNARDTLECTPLHFAVAYGNTPIATLLIYREADIYARNKIIPGYIERSAVDISRREGYSDIELILKRLGADIEDLRETYMQRISNYWHKKKLNKHSY